MAEDNGRWTLWLAGILSTLVIVVILPSMAGAIIQNDRTRADEDKRLEAVVMKHEAQLATLAECAQNIKADLSEIKSILKRTTPYERAK